MFSKKGKKNIWDYVESHEPYNPIEDLKKPKYVEGTVSVEHKELEKDIEEYWDLLHPLVADFINSYAITYEKMSKEVEASKESIEASRRNLTFEQQNVQDLSDQMREIKGQLQNEVVKRRDLEERLKDERDMLTSQFNEEKRALQILAETNMGDVAGNIDAIVRKVSSNVSSSEEVKRLKQKIDEYEQKIKEEREENERIQGELSTSFMEKITKYDEMIQNLKSRLGES